MSDDKFQAVIVGGGPAGLCAALALARGGAKEVYVLERGARPGSKNVFGGILFTPPLERLIPRIWETDAPLERPVTRRTFSLLGAEDELELTFKSASWAAPPHNHAYTVLRGRFDTWLAQQAEKAGVQVISGVVVDGLVRDKKGRVIGVQTRVEEGGDPAEGILHAQVVILAEGANALIAEREGLRPKTIASDMAVGVKEVIGLPAGKVADRFNLGSGEGAGREYFGAAVRGMTGSAFIYTNRESISLGVGVTVKELANRGMTPNDVLEHFKQHPLVKPFWEGGETLEYSAHMIPEAGYRKVGTLYADGLLVVGDAAGLVNASPYHEGTNLAMASGIAAGEAALAAINANDSSASVLSAYQKKLEASFVMQDMKKFADLPVFLKENPQLLSAWVDTTLATTRGLFTISETPKQVQEDKALDRFFHEIGKLPFITTMVKMRNAMTIYPLDPLGPVKRLFGAGK